MMPDRERRAVNSSRRQDCECGNWPLIEAGMIIPCNSWDEGEGERCRWECRPSGGNVSVTIQWVTPVPSMNMQ